ncbi:unnamed protein product [Clonostachys rosea f. rosea IK726]|uniref:Uncharacterized protein n=1 Tax=Clonostachys rosea f. rosea IK726 TaxID=1349383 RepID=A0ACA9UQ45_BIOOC|nr:unnamed protein product [Clonostachys rosea f. rosea IK726]
MNIVTCYPPCQHFSKMSNRSMYLAKYRNTTTQRAHFAIFIPNAEYDRAGLSQDYRSSPCKGTKIHVVGEPMLAGFQLEIKHNYECDTSQDLNELVHIGHVNPDHVHIPSSSKFREGDNPHGRLESEALKVPPPPNGQNIRAPIDGVTTRRCQEWTMEYLSHLVAKGLVHSSTLSIVQGERDAPNFGIFGQ